MSTLLPNRVPPYTTITMIQKSILSSLAESTVDECGRPLSGDESELLRTKKSILYVHFFEVWGIKPGHPRYDWELLGFDARRRRF